MTSDCGPLVGLVGLGRQPVHHRGGIGLGDLERAALARRPGMHDAGEDAERAEERPDVDADVRVRRHLDEPVVGDDRVDQSGPGVVGDAVARQVAVGAGGAVARDRAEDDARVDRPARLVADAPLGQAAGPHRLDDGVGLAHEVEERRLAVVGAQVEHDDRLPRLMCRCISETPSTHGQVISRM